MTYIDTPSFDERALRKERDGAIPRFYVEAMRNNARSEAEGRPCFDDVEMVEILIPGDRLATWVGRVNQGHRERWPDRYRAFKEQTEAPPEGTPIDQLPGITRSQVEEMRFQHVRTIEALAGLTDEQLSKVAPMAGRPMREMAQRWVSAVEGNAPTERLAAENRKLKDIIEDLERRMQDMQASLTEMEKRSPRSAAPEE